MSLHVSLSAAREAGLSALRGNGAQRRRPRISYGRMSEVRRQAYRAVSGVPLSFDSDRVFRGGPLHLCLELVSVFLDDCQNPAQRHQHLARITNATQGGA